MQLWRLLAMVQCGGAEVVDQQLVATLLPRRCCSDERSEVQVE